MGSSSENGCDTAVGGLKAGSMVIIEYLRTKIAKLQNELDALKTPDSGIDGFVLYEELWLSHKLSRLNELESLIELQKLSTEIVGRIQSRIGDLEMELMFLRALKHHRPMSDTHPTSVSDTHLTAELENNGDSDPLHDNEETSHTECLVIIQHLQSRIASLQHELSASKCDQAVEKDSRFDCQSSAGNSFVCGHSPGSEVITPHPSGGEIATLELHREYMDQFPGMESTDVTFSPGASDCNSKAPGKHKMSSTDSQMDGIVLQSDRIVLSGSPAKNQNINGSVGVKDYRYQYFLCKEFNITSRVMLA